MPPPAHTKEVNKEYELVCYVEKDKDILKEKRTTTKTLRYEKGVFGKLV